MSGVVIQGNPGNITTGTLSQTIASAVAGSGITTCTTAGAHLFGNLDTVYISGALGMTGLNGLQTITVTGATTFTIGSAFSGTYTASSATVADLSLTPPMQSPIDGQSLSVQLSGLLSSLQNLADKIAYVGLGGINQTEAMTLYTGLTALAASTVTLQGTLHAIGGSTLFTDGHTPLIPTTTRTIHQPLCLMTTSAFAESNGVNNFTDQILSSGTPGVYNLALTKLVNGATMTEVNITLKTLPTSPAAGANNQQIQVWKTNNATGASTQLGSTTTVPNGLTVNATSLQFVGGFAEVIDQSNYSYSLVTLQGVGGSAEPVIWYPPVVLLSNITKIASDL